MQAEEAMELTSKEMEQRSGVPRANIRYYEAEGLLPKSRLRTGRGSRFRRRKLLPLPAEPSEFAPSALRQSQPPVQRPVVGHQTHDRQAAEQQPAPQPVAPVTPHRRRPPAPFRIPPCHEDKDKEADAEFGRDGIKNYLCSDYARPAPDPKRPPVGTEPAHSPKQIIRTTQR